MAIFGRKKDRKTTAPSIHPQAQSASTLNLRPSGPPPYAVSSQPGWTYIEQRPSTSHGYSSPPQAQGWLIAPVPLQYQPVVVTPEYTTTTAPPYRLQNGSGNISKLNISSVVNLLTGNVPERVPGTRFLDDGVTPFFGQNSQHINHQSAICDLISSELDNIITLIDGERFNGDERELATFSQPQPTWQQQQETGHTDRGIPAGRSKGINNSVSSALTSMNYFAKVSLYANSRLPPNLTPLKLYIPTFPLLCLAAQYSEHVYVTPSGQEKETHVEANWRMGTKAMVIKSVPMDDMNTIVFAIRGTQTFMDWAVNLKSAPTSPEGFLDDAGNYCHAGFLTVAKQMIKPVAARLRRLLEEDPGRSKCSLLITGHSAGGAVAALLYSHMLSTSPETESELNILTGCFKRVHCVSFGAPPVSLLPLTKPNNPALRKSLFLSFVNEGDPVARAEKAYVRSLLELYTAPAPGNSCLLSANSQSLKPLISGLEKSASSLTLNQAIQNPKKARKALTSGMKKSTSSLTLNKAGQPSKKSKQPSVEGQGPMPIWPVPEATLSNAGRVVLLRSVERYETRQKRTKLLHERMNEGIVAQVISDDLLRSVVWGDPVCHMMRLYARRIEILATNAVMGRT